MSGSHMLMTAEEYVAYSGRPLHAVNTHLFQIAVLLSRSFRMCQCGTPLVAPTYEETGAFHDDHLRAVCGVRD